MQRSLALLILVGAVLSTSGRAEPETTPARATDVAEAELPRGNETYVQPNMRLADGRPCPRRASARRPRSPRETRRRRPP